VCNFNHWTFSDLVLHLNYFSFSHPNPNLNPPYLPKHEFLSPNNTFIRVFGVWNITLCMRTWCEIRNFASQKFPLTPVVSICPSWLKLLSDASIYLNTLFFLKKNHHADTCNCRNWKVTPDQIPFFLQNFDSGSGSERKTQNLAGVDWLRHCGSQRWSDSGFFLSDPILFLKNDIRIRSESCFGLNHTICIRKLSESILRCTAYICVLYLFCLMRQNNGWSYFAFS